MNESNSLGESVQQPELLQDVIDSLADGCMVLDKNERLVAANRTWQEYMNADAHIPKGTPVRTIIELASLQVDTSPYPTRQDWVEARLAAQRSPGQSFLSHYKDGRWISIQFRQMGDGGTTTLYTDVTTLKSRESELSAILDHIEYGVLFLDANLRIRLSNSRYRDLWNMPVEFLAAQPLLLEDIQCVRESAFYDIADEDWEAFVEQRLADIRAGTLDKHEVSMLDGRVLEVQLINLPNGERILTYYEITELKRRQARLAAILDSIDYGVLFLDTDLRIRLSNRRYREIWNLKDDFLAKQPLLREDIERSRENGSYGMSDDVWQSYVNRRMDEVRSGSMKLHEVTLTNGQVIEVQLVMLPDGERMLTYYEITELKRRQRELAAILDRIDFGVLFIDSDLRIRLSNSRYRQIWGLPDDFLESQPLLREDIERSRDNGSYAMGDEVWEVYLNERLEQVRSGNMEPHEVELSDGTVLRVQLVVLPEGERMLTYYEVTDLRHREKDLALAISEKDQLLEQWHAVLEHSQHGIAFAGSDGIVIHANKAFREIWGFTEEYINNKPSIRDLFQHTFDQGLIDQTPELWDQHLQERLKEIATGSVPTRELIRPDGRSILYDLRSLPGDLRMATYSDITELRQTDIKLRESEERYQLAIEGSNEGWWDWTMESGFINTSLRLREIAGLDPNKAMVDPGEWTQRIHKDDRHLHLEGWRRMIERETKHFHVEYRARGDDGVWRWVLVRGAALFDENDVLVRTVGSLSDISYRKEGEIELRRAKEQAEEANRTKSRFLANMSHELRTPLNAVIGITEMMAEEAEDAGDADYLEPLGRVERAGKHLLSLINELLDLSRIEAGKMELFLERVSVSSLVTDAMATTGPIAQTNNNTISILVNDDVGFITTDAIRLRQVLLNLVSNACKFTRNGKIDVRAIRIPVINDRDQIQISVTDTGIGMSEEEQHRIFDEFAQADSSTTRRFGGTGLGLTISKRLCELMGGSIAVDSSPGEGAVFTIALPSATSQDLESESVLSIQR